MAKKEKTEFGPEPCHCGEPATYFDVDPYMKELYPEKKQKPRWWCITCYDSRLDDI